LLQSQWGSGVAHFRPPLTWKAAALAMQGLELSPEKKAARWSAGASGQIV
jgi:hypothetical protein